MPNWKDYSDAKPCEDWLIDSLSYQAARATEDPNAPKMRSGGTVSFCSTGDTLVLAIRDTTGKIEYYDCKIRRRDLGF